MACYARDNCVFTQNGLKTNFIFELRFAAPEYARIQAFLARNLVDWVGSFKEAILWLDDWPFYKPDEMAIARALRRSHGESREVIDATGLLFLSNERDELTGWIALLLAYGWDGYVVTSPFRNLCFQTSHNDLICAYADDLDHLNNCKEIGACIISILKSHYNVLTL